MRSPVPQDDSLATRLQHLLGTTFKPGTSRLWTARELVDAINADGEVSITYPYFSNLRRGVRDNPSLPVIRAIAKALGVREGVLLEEGSSAPSLQEEFSAFASREISPTRMDLLRKLADELSAEGASSTATFAPQLMRDLTIDDVQAASMVREALVECAGRLRDELNDQPLADHLEGLAAGIRDYLGTYFRR